MALGIDKSTLFSLSLEAALWGFSVMMFGLTLYLLCHGRSSQQINHWNVIRSCLLFTGSTAHLCATINRIMHAFVIDVHRWGGPVGYLHLVHRENIFMCASYCFQTLLGDAIVIHRCYVVWQSIWVVIAPLTLWLATAGSFVGMLHHVVIMSDAEHSSYTEGLGRFMIGVFSLSLSSNMLATGLLAYRIYTVNRELASLQKTVMNSVIYPVMRTAIDAGALYTILLAAAIVNQVKSTDPFVLTNTIVPCISIIFYMVIMRIAVTQSNNKTTCTKPTLFRFQPTPQSIKIVPNKEPLQLTVVEVFVSDNKITNAKDLESPVAVDGLSMA